MLFFFGAFDEVHVRFRLGGQLRSGALGRTVPGGFGWLSVMACFELLAAVQQGTVVLFWEAVVTTVFSVAVRARVTELPGDVLTADGTNISHFSDVKLEP